MAEDYRIQVSIKGDQGQLLNVRGQTLTEVEGALDAIFGPGSSATIFKNLGYAVLPQSPEAVAQAFNGQVVGEVQTQAVAPQQAAPVPSAQPAAPVTQAPPEQAQPASPPCGICGIPKKWVPAGVSKKPPYKPYKGFYACDDNRDERHAQAKAAGVQE